MHAPQGNLWNNVEGAHIVMGIFIGKEHSNLSSIPGLGCLHFP